MASLERRGRSKHDLAPRDSERHAKMAADAARVLSEHRCEAHRTADGSCGVCKAIEAGWTLDVFFCPVYRPKPVPTEPEYSI